tara:strand:- start:932 stop:1522 length:591 start_codon:yes stop_codon:yes gene_type:complete
MNNRWPALLLALMLLAGCGAAPTVIQYYVIDSVPVTAVADLDGQSIQVLDLKLPQYLERFQLARRIGNNRLVFESNQQWGENLRKNLYRSLTRNLSGLLGTADVGTAISRSMATPDYVLRVSIEAFEQAADGRVQLAARYQISRGDQLVTRDFEARVERDSGDRFSDIVADMRDLFGDLSRDIAGTISEMEASSGS